MKRDRSILSPRLWRVLVGLGAATALNCVHFDTVGGAEFRFGALVAMPFILALTPLWAVGFAAISCLPIFLITGSPWLPALITLEAVWLVTLARRWRYPTIADLIYWMVVGLPAGLVLYVVVGGASLADAVVLLVNQSLSSLLAILLAKGIVRSNRFSTWMGLPPMGHTALRGMIFDAVFLLAALPLVVMAISVSLVVRNSAIRRERLYLEQAVAEVDRQIEMQLQSHRSAVVAVAKVAEKGGANVSLLLEEVRRAYPGFVTMLAADETGKIQETAPAIDWLHGADVSDREYFIRAKATNESMVSNVFRGRGFGDDVLVAISTPLQRSDGSFAGIVEGSLAVSQLGGSLMRSGLPPAVSVLVVDANDRVVLADAALGLRPLDKVSRLVLDKIPKTVDPDKVATIELPGSDGRLVRLHARGMLNPQGFSIIAVRPGGAALDQLLAVYLLLIVGVAAVLAGAVWLASVASRRIAIPLEHFARDAVDQAESGEVTAMVAPNAPVPREIAMVFAAFNCLAARVCEIHAALVDANAKLDARVAERTKELKEAQERAEAASRSKTDFVAMTGHEIRTPLNAIIGLAESVAESVSPGATAERVKTIHRAGIRLLGVVNDLLDLSRVEAGKLELKLAPVDIAAMVDEVIVLFESQARQKQLQLERDIQAPLPLWIEMDSARVQQVLINLVGNALKFTNQGGVRLQVRIEREQRDEIRLRFAVIDTGPGISSAEQTRLFQPYVQLEHTGEARTKGTGLGLSISRRLVELFGGELSVTSEPGRGAEFHFTAPFRRAARAVTASSSIDDMTGLRVLVVDDNVANQEVLRAFLERLRTEIVVVDSAPAAIACLRSQPFEVALVDLEMPDVPGEAVAQAMAQADSFASAGCRLIAVSAHSRQDKYVECIAHGFADYLAKPIRREELARVLRNVWTPQKGQKAAVSPAIA